MNAPSPTIARNANLGTPKTSAECEENIKTYRPTKQNTTIAITIASFIILLK